MEIRYCKVCRATGWRVLMILKCETCKGTAIEPESEWWVESVEYIQSAPGVVFEPQTTSKQGD